MQEQEISELEQKRLEEILKMCADFEHQNQSNNKQQSSPIVQNRIKTNGSLSRDKKSPFNEHDSSPNNYNQNLFSFTSNATDFVNQNQQQNENPQQQNEHEKHQQQQRVERSNSGYENVKFLPGRRIELLSSSSSTSSTSSPVPSTGSPHHQQHNGSPTMKSPNGYENVFLTKKCNVPQSPRTKIKTCISPKRELSTPPVTQKKSEYDLLVQSFEEKLRMEIQALRDNRNNFENQKLPNKNNLNIIDDTENVDIVNTTNETATLISINSLMERKNKNVNNLTLSISKEFDDKKIDELKHDRTQVLRKIRELKSQISELQHQEEEVLREVYYQSIYKF